MYRPSDIELVQKIRFRFSRRLQSRPRIIYNRKGRIVYQNGQGMRRPSYRLTGCRPGSGTVPSKPDSPPDRQRRSTKHPELRTGWSDVSDDDLSPSDPRRDHGTDGAPIYVHTRPIDVHEVGQEGAPKAGGVGRQGWPFRRRNPTRVMSRGPGLQRTI